MLFQLKKNNQENNQGTRLNNKIEKIKITLKKIKFVAKNVIYVRNWSKNPRLLGLGCSARIPVRLDRAIHRGKSMRISPPRG